jgi:hypothetical protein
MTTDKENQEPPRADNETKEMELDGKFMSWAVLFTVTVLRPWMEEMALPKASPFLLTGLYKQI